MHRDVKPSNIMLTPEGEVKLLDLGLARFYTRGLSQFSMGGPDSSAIGAAQPQEGRPSVSCPYGSTPSAEKEMTGTGQAMGTADYMAPEQASDSRTVDIRADIYSLGCTLYKLLSGRAPFSDPDYRSTLDKLNAHARQACRPFAHQSPPYRRKLPRSSTGCWPKIPTTVSPPRPKWPMPWPNSSAPADLPALLQRAIETKCSPLPPGEGQGEGNREKTDHSPSAAAPPLFLLSWGWKWFTGQLILLMLAGSLGFCLGVLIRIHKDGQETTIEVSEGTNARVTRDAQVDLTLPGNRPSEPDKATIEDMDVVRVTALDAREPMTWQWQVHLPKGHRYAWNVAYGEIPASGLPSRSPSSISNEPYWETGLDAVLTAALRRVDDKTWSLTLASRSLNTKWQFGGGSFPIPDAVLRPLLDAGSIEETILGNHGAKTLKSDEPVILLKRRTCEKLPDGNIQPSKKAMPGIMIWLRPLELPGEKDRATRGSRARMVPPEDLDTVDANAFVCVLLPPTPRQTLNEVGRLLGPQGMYTSKSTGVEVIDEAGRARQIRDLLKQKEARFGPVSEHVISAVSEGKGGGGVNLTDGKLVDVPKEFAQWPAQQESQWCVQNNVDLVVDLVPGGGAGGLTGGGKVYLVPEDMKLAALHNAHWDRVLSDEIKWALASVTPGDFDIGPGSKVKIAEVRERRGMMYFNINTPLPATFAFQTRRGDLGLLQVIRFTEEPSGIRIRYKLAQPTVAAAAAVPDEKAIQGTWEVVSSKSKLIRPFLQLPPPPEEDVRRTTRVVIRADTLKIGGPHVATEAFEYQLDPAANPKKIDLKVGSVVYQGIYELKGDQLRICAVGEIASPENKQVRPTEFFAEFGSEKELLVLRRAGEAVATEDEKAIQGTWEVESVAGGESGSPNPPKSAPVTPPPASPAIPGAPAATGLNAPSDMASQQLLRSIFSPRESNDQPVIRVRRIQGRGPGLPGVPLLRTGPERPAEENRPERSLWPALVFGHLPVAGGSVDPMFDLRRCATRGVHRARWHRARDSVQPARSLFGHRLSAAAAIRRRSRLGTGRSETRGQRLRKQRPA